jgi:hypothetical protein
VLDVPVCQCKQGACTRALPPSSAANDVPVVTFAHLLRCWCHHTGNDCILVIRDNTLSLWGIGLDALFSNLISNRIAALPQCRSCVSSVGSW